MIKILFADNDPDFLSTRAEFLERAGYLVVQAGSLTEAQRFLEESWAPLAVLDLRMVDDDDEKDISGWILARGKHHNSVHKIMLTNFPRHVHEILDELSPIIGFIEKQDGPEALIAAIEKAMGQKVRINTQLAIDWRARDPYSIARTVDPSLPGNLVSDRAEELTDLFRRLFYEKNHVRIERLLWERDGRVALVASAYRENMKPESLVVVCGRAAAINAEKRLYDEFAPRAPGDLGTRLSGTADTTHFAINAYAFANMNFERLRSLSDVYRHEPPKLFRDSLTTLFQKTLADWHQNQLASAEQLIEDLYRQRLQGSPAPLSAASLADRLKALEAQAGKLKLSIAHAGQTLTFVAGDSPFAYLDPLALLSREPQGENGWVANVPGTLTGENILADDAGHAWLTDFSAAGQAPLFWSHVALEAIIRFDWTDTTNFRRRQELEECLVSGDFGNPNIQGLEPDVLKPAQAILSLRRLAAQLMGGGGREYHLGIFYQACRRLADYDPAFPLSTTELMRLFHIYLSMAMLADKLINGNTNTPIPAVPSAGGLAILDPRLQLISVGARNKRLKPSIYRLFEYMYERAGEVCTKEEIENDVLGRNYGEGYIHTLVMRIRQEIEDDPDQPRYLITVPLAGYCLHKDPQ